MSRSRSGWEWKRADQIVVGDYLHFIWQQKDWLLEVVKVEAKRTRVWITVEEPASGETWTTRPGFADELRFKEAATVIEEAEERFAEGKTEEGDRGQA